MSSSLKRALLASGAILLLVVSVASATDAGSSANEPQDPPAIGPVEDAPAGGALVSLRITGSTLRPRENDVSYTVSSTGACVYVTSGDAFSAWNTAVTDLRQGATVDTLRMYFYDASGSDSSAWFTVYDLYGTIVQEWSVTSSGNLGNSFNDSSVIGHVVDYSLYSYALNWRPVVSGSSMQLCGFRIFYQH